MKALLPALLALTFPAFASTQAIFAADSSKATVLVLSMTSGDADAAKLYAALNVPEEVINGKRTRRLEFANSAGVRAFSVVCVMSAFIEGNGTCTAIVHASANSAIDKGALTARLRIENPAELAVILPKFVTSAGTPQIFATADGHFVISADRALEISFSNGH